MRFLLFDLAYEWIMNFFEAYKDTKEKWTPRKRSEEEEKLTEFEKKHYRDAKNDPPRHR